MCDNMSMGDFLTDLGQFIEQAQSSPAAASMATMAFGLAGLYLLMMIIKAGRPIVAKEEPATKEVTELQAPLFGLIRDFMGQVAQVAESNNKLAMAVEANTSSTEQLVRALSVSVHDEGKLTRAELGQDIKALVQVVDANNQLLAKVLKAWEKEQEAPRKPGRPRKASNNKMEAMKDVQVD